ncbi:MAG TPA: type II secretion system protein GspC [Candidatus Dormibacteraeota bacterium]|nr:type II secretion system protein GspC [Candidatus Dormibacteraeota bacterium]
MRGLRDMSFSPRYLVVVNLLLLALAAYSASSIVGTALAARLIPPPEVEISPPPAPLEIEPAKPATYYAVIPKRDIFNSVKPTPATAVVETVAAPTQLKLKLWGTAVFDKGNSFSIIEDLGARKQGVYGIDETVPGNATVKAIEWNRVILSHNGKDEILELEEPKTVGGVAKAVAQAPAAPAGANGSGIQQTAENEFTVPKSEVDSALENMSQLFTQIRAVPHFEGGQSIGFRLFAIRRGSLFDRIGLKNGDIIRSINGNEMTDPSKAMALLQELRDATNLDVEVTRNQQPQKLTYSIQ